jgi:hypothetical protein
LIFGGGTVAVNAPVSGKVYAAGGNITINSRVGGNLMVRDADTVTFGPKAEVLGTITVHAKSQPVVSEGARLGDIAYEPTTAGRFAGKTAAAAVAGVLISLVASLVVALIAVWLMPRKLEAFSHELTRRFLPSLGIGIAALVVTPIVAILLMVLVVGVYAGLVTLLLYIAALAVASILGVVWFGAWLSKLMSKREGHVVTWQTAVIGAIAMWVLRLIPILGGIAWFVILMAAFGQLLIMARHALVERHSAAS